MKRLIRGFVFAVCFFASVGWGSTYGNRVDRDKGHNHADEKHQKDDDDIKRAQGDESGILRDIHDNKNYQDEKNQRQENTL